VINRAKGLSVSKPNSLPQFANIGLGGVAGAGKTHLVGTVGKGKKLLSLDTEGGTATYNSKAFLADPNATEDIDVIRFDDVSNVTELVHRAEQPFDYLIQNKNKDGYDLVVLDSLTEFQERFLMMHQANDPRQSYGALREAVGSIVRKAQLAPVHTVFTARLRQSMDEVLNREIVRFQVSPGVWSVISGLFDVIAFMDIKSVGMGKSAKNVRTLNMSHTTRTQGKDRWGIGEMQDPSFADILSIINGGN
jgi:hypothetical protein